jgi:hypothetical protein
VLRLKDWLGHDDLGRISPSDVQRWGDQCSAEDKSAKTIFGKDGTTAGPANGVYKRITDMVRNVLPDDRVQPNHAWRSGTPSTPHAHDAGLDSMTVDAICGHEARTQGEAYRGITVKKRMEVMAAFPRYALTQSCEHSAA